MSQIKRRTEFSDLSPEQQKVVSTWGQGLAIMAGAGSGKTTTLVIKCAELLKRKSDARFAAVSFTEKSASDLRAKLSDRLSLDGEGGALSGHWVMTIHGLCGAIIREYPREAGYDGEETMLSEGDSQRLWEKAIEQLWSDETPEEIEAALEIILNRESRHTLQELLKRARDLYSVGILESLAKQEDEASQAFSVLAEFVIERYDRLKRRRGALDFNDLERGADRALEHFVVREAFQRRFDLVLVDEFQDTNPLQARIIVRFAKQDFSNLCVVGDPKQSIYRFRDADVSVFEDFCRRLPQNLSLTWNFRSRPGIIEFTNDVCHRAFDAVETGSIGHMVYEPLTPRREVDPELAPVTRLNVSSPNDLATWIQSEVEKGIPLEDMALLLRKIRGNAKWLKALTSAGIPIAVGSGGLFWEDPRVREIVSFLKWWGEPRNTLSGGVFLRSPWVGVADKVLDKWFERDPTGLSDFFSASHLEEISNSGDLARNLFPFRNRIVRPAEILMALLANANIEDEIGSPLLGLWHRVEELSSSGLDFTSAVAELAAAMEEGRREREVAPPRNQGQLPVLTFHGAKGLEFKHVILVDLGAKNRAPNSPLLYWDREQGAYLARKDEMGERIKDPKNTEEDQWKARERAKELAEGKRVFYVALTRAEERLIFVCPELFDRKGEPLIYNPDEVYSQDFWRGWIECSSISPIVLPFTDQAQPFRSKKTFSPRQRIIPIDKNFFTVKRPRHSVTEWSLLSRCPRAYDWTYVHPEVSTISAGDLIQKNGSLLPSETTTAIGTSDSLAEGELSQRELGTRVHACLETGDYDGLHDLEFEAGEMRFKAERVISWAKGSPFMNSKLGGFEKAWSELSFESPVSGEILVGSMDRVIQHFDKTITIVDFKVTRHEKTREELLDSYQTQMELYRWAIGRVNPSASQINGVLVGFSDRGVLEIPIESLGKTEISRIQAKVDRLANEAAAIISFNGLNRSGSDISVGLPTPNSLCDVCQFVKKCPEGTARKLTSLS